MLSHTRSYQRLIDQLIEEYLASGQTHHDQVSFKRGHRKVNVTHLVEAAFHDGTLKIHCPICGGTFITADETGLDRFKPRTLLDAIIPKKNTTHLMCDGCGLEIRSAKPLIEALAEFADACEDADQSISLLPGTQQILDQQFAQWSNGIQHLPPALQRSIKHPFAPPHSVQVKLRRRAMAHISNLLRNPRNVGLTGFELHRALRTFRGRTLTQHDNLFAFLEHHQVITPFGGVSEKLLRQAMSILTRNTNTKPQTKRSPHD